MKLQLDESAPRPLPAAARLVGGGLVSDEPVTDGNCGVPEPPEQRPTSIPRFNVADYARRCDASIRGSVIGAMPPLRELALRHRSSKQQGQSRKRQPMTAGFAALLNSLADKPSAARPSPTIKEK